MLFFRWPRVLNIFFQSPRARAPTHPRGPPDSQGAHPPQVVGIFKTQCFCRNLKNGTRTLGGHFQNSIFLREFENWTRAVSKKYKFSKSKSVLPKMSARSGLVGKNPLGPISCNFRHLSRGADPPPEKKKVQVLLCFLGGPMGLIQPLWVHPLGQIIFF